MNRKISTRFLHTLVLGCALLMAAHSANAATISFIKWSDWTTYESSKLEVSGVSDDGLTLVGTIRMVSGGDGDRGFYWRKDVNGNGVLTVLPGLGFTTYATGISADGLTLIGTAKDPELASNQNNRLMLITNLGGPGQTTQYLLPGGALSSLSLTAFSTTTRGQPISSDGSTIVGVARTTTSANSSNQFMWSAASGYSYLSTLPPNSGSIPVGLSADGSVVVGNTGTSNTNPPGSTAPLSTAYRWTQSTGFTFLTKPDGSSVQRAAAVSDDGNTIAARGGVWTVSGGYHELAGYTALGFDGAAVEVASTDLLAIAITADGSWVGGYSNNGNARTGWIANLETDTTYEITQYLADHGIDTTGLLPTDVNGDPLFKITGLTLIGYDLTIVGNTYNENGWVATVAVPEPGSCMAVLSLAGLAALRRRRRLQA